MVVFNYDFVWVGKTYLQDTNVKTNVSCAAADGKEEDDLWVGSCCDMFLKMSNIPQMKKIFHI